VQEVLVWVQVDGVVQALGAPVGQVKVWVRVVQAEQVA
jgi:hypothetical protein